MSKQDAVLQELVTGLRSAMIDVEVANAKVKMYEDLIEEIEMIFNSPEKKDEV